MPNIELSVSTTIGNIQDWFYLVSHMDNIVKKIVNLKRDEAINF